MDHSKIGLAPCIQEVPMVEPEIVRAIRDLSMLGWGSKRISRQLEIARNTVRRYLRGGAEAEIQKRPRARRLDDDQLTEAERLFTGVAAGNAVVVRDEFIKRGVRVSLRTVQRAVAGKRRKLVAAQAATVRYETAPGEQMQVDFGQRIVTIGGKPVRVYLLVAVLSYSRRIFVRPYLHERQENWRDGIAAAFRHFGGVPRTILVDNARALVLERDRKANTVRFHPAFIDFCRDWDVTPRACQPYPARTKGKVESGIKYVKRNGLAGREFTTFAALEAHLAQWQNDADQRIHGTTHEMPISRFLRDEAQVLRPLPARPVGSRPRRLQRQVSNDAYVEVDTVRYSVPYQLVRDRVEVVVQDHDVQIFHGTRIVAKHSRSLEPYSVVRDPSHHAGLWRASWVVEAPATGPSRLEAMGRSLADYQAVVTGVAL